MAALVVVRHREGAHAGHRRPEHGVPHGFVLGAAASATLDKRAMLALIGALARHRLVPPPARRRDIAISPSRSVRSIRTLEPYARSVRATHCSVRRPQASRLRVVRAPRRAAATNAWPLTASVALALSRDDG